MIQKHGKVFFPNIMPDNYYISKKNAHQDSMCLTSTEERNKIFDYLLQSFSTINQPMYRNVETENEIGIYCYQIYVILSSFKEKKTCIYM